MSEDYVCFFVSVHQFIKNKLRPLCIFFQKKFQETVENHFKLLSKYLIHLTPIAD